MNQENDLNLNPGQKLYSHLHCNLALQYFLIPAIPHLKSSSSLQPQYVLS